MATTTTTIVLMAASEARQAAETIKSSAQHLRRLIFDFETREGWRVLGFDSFRAWASAELDASMRHVYRQLAAAEVEANLGVTIGHTPESHLRPLAELPPDQQRSAMARADELAGGSARQARHVAQAAAELGEPPLTSEEITDLSALAGLERDGERITPAGFTLIRLRDDRSGDRLTTEERTPGGWRLELATLRARRDVLQLAPAPTPDAFNAVRVDAAHRGWQLGASTDAPTVYFLIPAGVHDPREQEHFADWPALLARAGSLPIRPSTPAPTPGTEARIAALGARLEVRGLGYLLAERGSSRQTTYADAAALEARIAFLEGTAAFEARAARGLTTVTAPDAPPDPLDWDAWQARARSLGGRIAQSIAGQATLTLGGRNVAWTSAAPGATWAALCQHIVDAEQLGVAAADLSANPAPPEQFAEAQRLASGAGMTLDWHSGLHRFVLTEADGGGSGYPRLAWAQCLGRLDHLLAQQEAAAHVAAEQARGAGIVAQAAAHRDITATARYDRAERAIQELIDALSPAQQTLLAALMLDDFEDGDDAPRALWERLTEVADANPEVVAWALPDAAPAPLAPAAEADDDTPGLAGFLIHLAYAEARGVAEPHMSKQASVRLEGELAAFAAQLDDARFEVLSRRVQALWGAS